MATRSKRREKAKHETSKPLGDDSIEFASCELRWLEKRKAKMYQNSFPTERGLNL